jgi:hypothetical protein
MRLRLSALAAGALAGSLLVAACSAGAAKPETAPSAAGAVHLSAYAADDGPTSTVILTGAIGDYGVARSVHPDGSVNPDHDSQLDLAMQHGSFRLDIADLDRRLVAVLRDLAVNTATCSATASVQAAVAVVSGSGTGAYQAIHGGFTLTVTLDEVFHPGECSETGSYVAQSVVTSGSGTVSLG